jgi:tubulin-specific chaperone D
MVDLLIMGCKKEMEKEELKTISNKYRKIDQLFRVLYFLCKVRRYKTVSRLFPCKPEDYRLNIKCLKNECKEESSSTSWETRYMLLIWLSMVVLIPFDFWRLENIEKEKQEEKGSLKHLIEICKSLLSKNGKESEGASILISKLLNRPDISKNFRESFLEWCFEKIDDQNSDAYLKVKINYKHISSISHFINILFKYK